MFCKRVVLLAASILCLISTASAERSRGIELPTGGTPPIIELPTTEECDTGWAYYYGLHEVLRIWDAIDIASGIGGLDGYVGITDIQVVRLTCAESGGCSEDLVWALEVIELQFEIYDNWGSDARRDGQIEVVDIAAALTENTKRLILCPGGLVLPTIPGRKLRGAGVL